MPRQGGGKRQPMPEQVRGGAGWRKVLPELLLSSLVLNVLALALPLALLQMYDRIVPNQSYATLTFLVIGVILAVTLEAVLKGLRGSITGWLGARFEHRVGTEALRHLASVPIQKFRATEAGTHAERLGAAAKVRDFYSGETLSVYLDLPFVVIFLGVIAAIGGSLVLVPVFVLLAFALVLSYQGRSLRRKISDRATLDDRRFNFMAETIGGVHSVKTMAMEPLMYRRYERLQEAGVAKGSEVASASAAANNIGTLFTQLMIIGVVAAGSLVVLQGGMTPGGLAACILLSVRALQPLRRSLATWMRYQSVSVARERLRELFSEPSEAGMTRPPLPAIQGAVELRGVSLRHPGMEHDLLQDVSLDVAPGECVAICGQSGSGKSSLLSVMNGASRPDKGEVLIDGMPVTHFDPDTLHQEIAYLPQHGELVTGTILENITMFRPRLDERAMAVARDIGLEKLVAHMRLGYDTVVGDGVTESMPGGIRQRIAIARALVVDPAVLLFDEANINLDLEGDEVLRKYLEQQKGERTVVLVTYRPTLLKLASRVFSLSDGRLVEDGGASGRDDKPPETGSENRAIANARPDRNDFSVADTVNYFDKHSDFSVCLPALLAAVEWQGVSRELPESMPHMAETLDLSGLRNVMANLGYRSSSYSARMNNLDPRLLPCLFVPDNGGAKVVMDRDEDGSLSVFDSETLGVERVETPPRSPGEAFVFTAETNEGGQGERKRWTRRLLSRFSGLLIFVFALTIVSTLLTLAPPVFVRTVFNTVLPTGSLEPLLIGGVLLAVGLDWALRNLKANVMGHIAGRAEYILGNSVFQRVLALPAHSIERVSVGAQIARIRNLEALRDFFQGPLSIVLTELPAIFIYVTILGIMNPPVLFVIGSAAVLYIVLGVVSYGPQQRRTLQASRLAAERSTFLTETLDKLPMLRVAGATGRWLERFGKLSGQAAHAEWRAQRVSERIGSVAQLIGIYTGVGALTLTVVSAMQGTGSTGAVMATMIIIWRLTGPMYNGFMSAGTLIRVTASLRQVDNLMNMNVERDAGASHVKRPETKGAVAFSRVSFRYSMDADPAMLGVTFSVEPGQVVAIAGPNGSGKSTLLKLLVRNHTPQAGSILIDNVDIRQLPAVDLRAQIAYMPQQCEIFYGTIAQNLRLVEPTASQEELEWAARMAGLLHEVQALPEGWDTRISDSRADQLPSGFRQRLSLARTLLRRAPIMLFDEPGNGLDQESDKAFMDAVRWLRGKSTVFIVSHRPSHMRLADVCLYLDQGAIRASGRFDDIKQTIFSGLK